MHVSWPARGSTDMAGHGASSWRRPEFFIRAEHVALVLLLSALVLWHADNVSWLRFASAFAAIDLVGYLPGAISCRMTKRGRISPLYYFLYNVAHSYLTAGVVVAVWAIALGHLEWAMLALPIHLSGDRGLFGNTYKSTSLPFEGPAGASAGGGLVQTRDGRS